VIRRLALVAVALWSVRPAGAQQSLLGPGAAFVSVGVAQVATLELDDRLAANGYPTFGQRATTIGIGAYRVVRTRLMLGGEFNGLVIGEEAHLGRNVGEGGGYATLGVAYAMQLSPRVRFYPRFGLGAGGLALWVETADTTTFDDVLANPTPPTTGRLRVLSRDGGVVDLGAGLEFFPRGRASGALIGLRLGYLLSSFGSESTWQLTDGAALGGPSASITGAYLRVLLGGAWTR
jgi:hypothetical protein